jgi:hypothetical protein
MMYSIMELPEVCILIEEFPASKMEKYIDWRLIPLKQQWNNWLKGS